ncbi:MAG: OmpH family outer membrane protein [Flavobacteriales bacterium]|jgi:Skp family chaperone for outer membrane proteins|nr:OmpH family outer membrane protein [Flavobacteriales bacterium]
MPARTSLILIIWNILLTGLLAWSLLRPAADRPASPAPPAPTAVLTAPDTADRGNARIAYFFMDSIQSGSTLVKEQGDRLRNEGRRLEQNLQREMDKAQQRYQELMGKDHTYSTQAELQKDEQELQGLMGKVRELQARSQEQLATLEIELLASIGREIEGFLEEYNRTAGHDFIFSVQDGGQIWVGNPGLDITGPVLGGLNARHAQDKQQSGQ